MRKILILLLVTLLAVSCNPNINKDLKVNAIDQYNSISGNPFTTPIARSVENESGDFSFLLVSDTHLGKEDGFRVDDKFSDWLDENGAKLGISFIVNLGDLTDDSKQEEFDAYNEELRKWQEATGTDIFIPVIGNHDNRIDGPALFMKEYSLKNTYYRFDFNGVEFYILDTSFRSMGRQQLALFEKAMETADKSTPKIVLSHVPLHGSSTVIYAAMTDSAEVRSIVQAMRKGGAGAYLTGHQHKGEIHHEYSALDPSESINELIVSCFFGGTIRNFTPRFYVCHYHSSSRTLVIDVYSYSGNEYVEEEGKYSFPL